MNHTDLSEDQNGKTLLTWTNTAPCIFGLSLGKWELPHNMSCWLQTVGTAGWQVTCCIRGYLKPNRLPLSGRPFHLLLKTEVDNSGHLGAVGLLHQPPA